jgi:hypothetical protein
MHLFIDSERPSSQTFMEDKDSIDKVEEEVLIFDLDVD